MKKTFLFLISFILLSQQIFGAATVSVSNIIESRCTNSGSFKWSVVNRVGANTYIATITEPISNTLLNRTYPDTSVINLYPGTYTIILKENGVQVDSQVFVLPGNYVNPAAVLDSTSKETCPSTGKIWSRLSGGRLPITYVLKNASNVVLSTQVNNGVFTGLIAGIYSVQITDSCATVRNIPNIIVSSTGGIPLSFGNNNYRNPGPSPCNVGSCNNGGYPMLDMVNQTCSGFATLASVMWYDYHYIPTPMPLTNNSTYPLAGLRTNQGDPYLYDTSATLWPLDMSQPINKNPQLNTNPPLPAPNPGGFNAMHALQGMVGGIPPYSYFLKTPSGSVLGPQIRPVFTNQPMGGVYYLIGIDACGTKDTLATNTAPLPTMDSLYFTTDNTLSNVCAPLNLQTFTGAMYFKGRIDSNRINQAVPANDNIRRYRVTPAGIGPWTWEIESSNDPSFVAPTPYTGWGRASGTGSTYNIYTNSWQMNTAPILYFKGGYNYIAKVTDKCGQVQRLNIQPAISQVDTVFKPNIVQRILGGCDDKFGFFNYLGWTPQKPNTERQDLEIYDTTGFLHWRALDVASISAGGTYECLGHSLFPYTLGYLPKYSKFILKITGKCTGVVLYDTLNFADYTVKYDVETIQPCIAGGVGAVKMKRAFTQVPGTVNSAKVQTYPATSGMFNSIVLNGSWTPDSISKSAPNATAANAAVVAGTPYISFNSSKMSDSILIPNLPIGKYTTFMNAPYYGTINYDANTYRFNTATLCQYRQFQIYDYLTLKVTGISKAVCAPDTAGTIEAIAQNGKAPFRYQIKKTSDPDALYSPMQVADSFPKKVPGNYTIKVTDTCGNANVINITNGGIAPFTITPSGAICAGSTIFLKNTTRQFGIRYTWYHNGVVIPNSNVRKLPIYNATISDGGVYKCVILDTTSNCGQDSAETTITVAAGPTAIVTSTKLELCAGDSIFLSGTASNNPGTIGTWDEIQYPISGSIVPGYTTPNLNTTGVTNTVSTDQNLPYIFLWSINTGSCLASDTIMVKLHKAIDPFAGTLQTLCNQTTATLNANQISVFEKGLWTQKSGLSTTIVANTIYNSGITSMLPNNTYVYNWQVWNVDDPNKVCAKNSQVTIVNYPPLNKLPNAGNDTVICTKTSSFIKPIKGNTIGIDTARISWSIMSKPTGATASIDNKAINATNLRGDLGGDYIIEYSFISPCGILRDTQKITYVVGNAGPDRFTCDTPGSSFIIAGSPIPAGQSGLWTRLSNSAGTATITTNSIYNPTLSAFSTSGNYYFEYQMIHPNCIVRDTMIVTLAKTATKPNAGLDSTICGSTLYLTGVLGSISDSSSIKKWSRISPLLPLGGTITKPDSLKTTVTGISNLGTYTYELAVENKGCPIMRDTLAKTVILYNPNITVDNIIAAICNQNTLGSMAVNASGASLFSIDNGTTFQSSNVFNNLAADTPYNVVVKNSANCIALYPVNPLRIPAIKNAPTPITH